MREWKSDSAIIWDLYCLNFLVTLKKSLSSNVAGTDGQYGFPAVDGSIAMAEHDTRRIVHDCMSEPHIRGRRISVRQVYALVEKREEAPEAVADRYDLDVADVHHALAYYHDHPREMREVKQTREDAIESFHEMIDRPEGVDPDMT